MDRLSDSGELDKKPIAVDNLLSPSDDTATFDLHEAETSINKDSINFSGVEEQTDTDISSISRSQEQTRARIAWVFTQIFLLLVVMTLVLPTVVAIGFPHIFSDPIETSKTLLTTMASVLAGPFGFIVGFYFKKGES